MSAYSTREVNREQAERLYLEYMEELHKRPLQRLSDADLEEALNEFAEKFPELYLLTNWRVVKEAL